MGGFTSLLIVRRRRINFDQVEVCKGDFKAMSELMKSHGTEVVRQGICDFLRRNRLYHPDHPETRQILERLLNLKFSRFDQVGKVEGRTVFATINVPRLTREVIENKEKVAGLQEETNLIVMALQKVQKEQKIKPAFSPQQLRILVDRATSTPMTLMRPVNNDYADHLSALEQIGSRHGIVLSPTREAIHHVYGAVSNLPRVLGPKEREESLRIRAQKSKRVRRKWYKLRDLSDQQRMQQAVLLENQGMPRHRVLSALDNTLSDYQKITGGTFRKTKGPKARRA